MKRTFAAVALAIVAGVSAADQYRLNAGEPDPVTPVAAAADAYRLNAGETESDNVVQTQLG